VPRPGPGDTALPRHFGGPSLSHTGPMKKIPLCLLLLALACVAAPPAARADTETMPEHTLLKILDRQKSLLAQAAKEGDKIDAEAFRAQVQDLCHEYDILLHQAPGFAPAYADYGYLLSKMGMDKEGAAMLYRADKLDPTIPMVNNQIGNHLAEHGQVIPAADYFREAIRLAPEEPLYHYQLGTLLHEGRDDFVKTGRWTAAQVEREAHAQFQKAAELAPERIEFMYRYAESFSDIDSSEWDKGLKVWADMEEKEPTAVGREIIRLQAANMLIRQGRYDPARVLIATVTEPKLDRQKQKLVAQLPENAKK
jgi:tetratricopeptide (TPR) repeat protein